MKERKAHKMASKADGPYYRCLGVRPCGQEYMVEYEDKRHSGHHLFVWEADENSRNYGDVYGDVLEQVQNALRIKGPPKRGIRRHLLFHYPVQCPQCHPWDDEEAIPLGMFPGYPIVVCPVEEREAGGDG